MKSKYIVIKRVYGEEAIIFGELFDHNVFLNMLGIERKYLVSAGFVSIGCDKDFKVKVSAYGKSVSLKVESRPEDDELLEKVLGIYEPDF